MNESGGEERLGLAGVIARTFADSKLTPLIIAFALGAGVFAILNLPREEEPQIVVPMIDVFVSMPGAFCSYCGWPRLGTAPFWA